MEQSENKKISNQQILARNYIQENELERIINEMLNSLVNERAKDPAIYMIKYLAGLISEEEKKQNGFIIPGPYPKSQPISKYPHMDDSTASMLKKTLTKTLFNSIKFLKTKHGGNINHILKISESNPQDKVGCLLTDGDCLPVFHELFTPIINRLHDLKKTQSNYDNSSMQKVNLFFPYYKSIQAKIKSFSISYSRNIKQYPYCNTIDNDKRSQVEFELTSTIDALIKEKTIPEMNHITYKTDQFKWNEILSGISFDIDWNQKAQMASNWPDYRCIYYNDALSTIILINFNDHFQLLSIGNEGSIELNNIIMTTKDILNHIEQNIQFDYSQQYGYMNSSLKLLGAGLALSITIQVNDLQLKFKDNSTIMDLVNKLNFDDVRRSNDDNNTLAISSSYTLSNKTEKEFIELFYSKICGLLHLNQANNLGFSQLVFPKEFKVEDEYLKSAYQSTYDDLRYVICSSGLNINHILDLYINRPNNSYGIILQDATQFIAFKSFLSKYLNLSQQYDIVTGKRFNDPAIKEISKGKSQLSSISISIIRNIEGYPFPTSYLNQNAKVESLIINALNTLNMKEHFGDYFSIDKGNERDQATKIIKENNIKLSNDADKDVSYLQQDFPLNRGVIQFSIDNSFAVVNDINHLQFYINIKHPSSDNLNQYLYSLLKLLNEFSKQIKFASCQSFGILSACPKVLGTGMTISIEIDLSLINKDIIPTKISKSEYDYVIDEVRRVVILTNKITIGRSENEIFCHMINTVNSLFDANS